MRLLLPLGVLIFALGASQASALAISGQLSGPAAANAWTLELSLDNTAGDRAVEEITVFFPVDTATNLSLVAIPSGWDWLVIQPDPFLPDDGFVDGLAIGPSLGIGESLTGLSIAFDWSGAGTPDGFTWTVVDPVTFVTLESGIVVIPEPSSAVLVGLGLSLLAGSRTRRPVQPRRFEREVSR